jgi:hypothetical protein
MRIEHVVLQPEENIFLYTLIGIPSDFPLEGTVEELTDRVAGMREFIEEGVQEARKRMAETGEDFCALEGRLNVPATIKGVVSHKGTLDWLEPDQTGVVTAYLPEQETFAVDFGKDKGGWITFHWTEEEFLKHFETVTIF